MSGIEGEVEVKFTCRGLCPRITAVVEVEFSSVLATALTVSVLV